MVSEQSSWKDWFLALFSVLDNIVSDALVSWVIRRRGVEFIYWFHVPEWETYLRENPQYDPSADMDAAAEGK